MTRLWDELEGVYLAGEYALQQYMGSEGEAAFFRTAFGPEQHAAALKLVADEPSIADEQLALWRKVEELAHPNLLPLLDCGRAEAAGDSFLYAVFELPDDSLVGALANGPLSEEETREVLAASLGALHYIHENGMVHGAVDADHIVAVGDRIKLASDTLRPAGIGATAADDIHQLGALLYRVRTGQAPEPGVVPDTKGISDPLAAIIRNTLEPDLARRASLADIDAMLNPRPAAVRPPTTEVVREEAPVRAAEPFAGRPERPERTELTEPPALLTTPAKRPPSLLLLLAAAGAVVVAVVLAMTQRSTPDAPWRDVAPAAATSTAAAEPAKPAPVSTPIPSAAPPAATTAPEPAPSRTAKRAESREGKSWRVIAYTYNHREHAEHKISTINKLDPGLHASLFAPRGPNQPPFFVALGGRMSRSDAVALQKKARSMGLPRDTFVRNFSD
jgi:eukaryotic-like serine/threonine-protein kinase